MKNPSGHRLQIIEVVLHALDRDIPLDAPLAAQCRQQGRQQRWLQGRCEAGRGNEMRHDN